MQLWELGLNTKKLGRTAAELFIVGQLSIDAAVNNKIVQNGD